MYASKTKKTNPKPTQTTYYAVVAGRVTGVFDDWLICQRYALKNQRGVAFKKYMDLDQAYRAAHVTHTWTEQALQDEGIESISEQEEEEQQEEEEKQSQPAHYSRKTKTAFSSPLSQQKKQEPSPKRFKPATQNRPIELNSYDVVDQVYK